MEEQKIRAVSSMEMLNSYRNKVLEKYIKSKIDIEYWQEKNPDEVVATTQNPPLGKGQMPTLSKITAGKALEEARKILKEQKRLLDIIDKLKNEVGN